MENSQPSWTPEDQARALCEGLGLRYSVHLTPAELKAEAAKIHAERESYEFAYRSHDRMIGPVFAPDKAGWPTSTLGAQSTLTDILEILKVSDANKMTAEQLNSAVRARVSEIEENAAESEREDNNK